MIFRKKRFGLAGKFILIVSLSALIPSLALSYSLMRQNLRQIDATMMERGRSMARGLAHGSEYGLLIDSAEALGDIISKYSGERGVLYLAIRDKSGKIRVSYGNIEENANSKPVEKWLKKGEDEKPGYHVTDTGSIYDFTYDVFTIRAERIREDIGLLDTHSSRKEKIGMVQIGLSKYDMIDSINRVKADAVRLIVISISVTVLAVAFKQSSDAIKRQLKVEKRMSRELEKKAAELGRINEELNIFVYTVSHDLRSPLVSLQGFSSMLMRDHIDHLDEDGRMYIQRIQKNVENMGTLIADLLEISRVGRIESRSDMVDVSDVISDVTSKLEPQLDGRGIKIIVRDSMPEIECNRIGLSQVFTNLISNASKFMGENNEDPTIQIGYDSEDGFHRFYVKDNGIGIDEKYHKKIFQIFQRLHDIKAEGTGAGLAIVEKIVENMGGRIWVDSAKGMGTTMYFTIHKTAYSNDREADETYMAVSNEIQ